MPKKAKLIAETVQVICPHCFEGVAEPESGSLYWTVSEIRNQESRILICGSCDKAIEIRMPKQVPLEA